MNTTRQHKPGHQEPVKTLKSIRVKFLIGFVLLFSILFFGIGLTLVNGLVFSSYEGWKGDAEQAALANLNIIADLKKERITQWFMERQGDAQVLADNQLLKLNTTILLADSDRSANNEESYRALLSLSKNKQAYDQIHGLLTATKTAYATRGAVNYQHIRVVNIKTGQVLVSTDEAEIGSPIKAKQEFLKQVVRSGDYYLSDVVIDPGSSAPHMHIAHTISDSKGVAIGFVVLEIPISFIYEQFLQGRNKLGETGEIFLINDQGSILTPLRHFLQGGTEARVLQDEIKAKPARLAAAGKEGSIESKDYRGREVIVAYRFLNLSPDWGWGLIVKIDTAQLIAAIIKATRYTLWLGGIGLFLVIALSTLLTRHLTEPLRNMTRMASRMASGDRSARIQVGSEDEIGHLSSAFNAMAAEIEASQTDLERRIGERTILLDKEILERRQAEQKVRQLNTSLEKRVAARTAELATVNQELESFAYSVAHDLRAPLRAIDGFSQALVEDYGERLDGEAKEFLGYLREGSQEMGVLIDDLLKLSRATRGEISRQDIDLSQLATTCVQALQQTEPERKVEVDIAAGIIVNADRRLMQVMLENLLGNAWKFTARETAAKIEFGADPVGKKVRCFIRDNGVGFDMAYQNKLFTPFTRLHSREDFEGTGIGLSTVQRIINRHGGTITATSSIGDGACFTFELDAAENDVPDDCLTTVSQPPGEDG